MPAIAFPVSTSPGLAPTESGGRLINAYADPLGQGARSPVAWRRCAGLRTAFQTGDGTYRGSVTLGAQVYIANGDTVYLVTKSGTSYTVEAIAGTLPGTGPVLMARNMNTSPQVLIVHSLGMSQIVAGVLSDYSDPDLPAVNSIVFLDSYFFVTSESGYVFASANNDLTFADTDYERAEAQPDELLRAISFGRDLLLCGRATIEFFSNTANPTGFPFSRSTVKTPGLWGRYAVAGFEEAYPGNVMLVGSDNTVREVSGYDLIVRSKPDIEKLISEVTDRDSLEMSVYVDRGRPVTVLSSPDWTWEYSGGNWNERKSLGQSRWKAHGGIFAFNAEWLVFDTETSDVYVVDSSYAKEGEDQLVFESRSTQGHRFPGMAVFMRASFDMQTGVGSDTGAAPDPQVQISWSDDGGVTFGNPRFRSLGTQGQIVQIDVRNAGLSRRYGRQWRIVVADPVDVALYGGAVDIEERKAAGR